MNLQLHCLDLHKTQY